MRAGSGWAGESHSTTGQVGGRCSTQNILMEQLEYHNGHGLRADESGLGGVRNVTWRDITVNGNGPRQNATLNGRPHVVRFTVRPDRGGVWEDISWLNISGDNVLDGISMLQTHAPDSGGWPLPLPPQHTENLSTAPPTWRNIAVRDLVLTNVGTTAAGGFVTLAAAPIVNLTLDRIHLTFKEGSKAGWSCVGLQDDGERLHNRLFVSGGATQDIQPPLSLEGATWNCSYSTVWELGLKSDDTAAIFYERGQAAQDVRLWRAVLEARRFLYELSGEMPVLHPLEDGSADLLAMRGVLVSVADRLNALHPALSAAGVPTPAAPGSHFVQRLAQLVVVAGADSTATLYAVYTMLEALGVRFRIGGDVIPRGLRGHRLAPVLASGRSFATRREWQSPNMALRGSQPFFDFPAGPDWWGTEEYKWFMEQISKQKMNFLGLHTYHNEPTVWQDSANASHFDPESGNITNVKTYPGTQ